MVIKYIESRSILTIIFFVFSMALWNRTWVITDVSNLIKWPLLMFSISVFLVSSKFKLYTKNIDGINVFFLYFFLCIITLSTWVSSSLDERGTANLLGYFLVFLFSLFLLLTSKVEKLKIHDSLGIVSIVVVIASIPIYSSLEFWGGARFKGVFDNTNGLGSICVMSVIYSLHKLLTSVKYKFWYGTISLLSLFLIFSTQSRGALLGLLVSVIALAIIKQKAKLLFLALSLFIVLNSAVSYIGGSINESYQTRELELSIDSARDEMLAIHLSKFEEKPIIGQGLSYDNNGNGRLPSELAYTDILSFSGLLGFSFFIIALIRRCLIIFDKKVMSGDGNVIGFVMFLSIVMMSLGDGYISNIGNPLSIFFWLYILKKEN